jgi:hypothetical protein
MKCMPVLKEMHGPQPLLPPGVARATTNGTSTTPTRHMHATTSDHAATTRVYYTKVTEFPTVCSITRAPLERKQ